MATIRKRGEKWQVQVRRQGMPPVTRSFRQHADAAAWARQMEVEADKVGLIAGQRMLQKTLLSDLITRYRDEVASKKRTPSETIVLDKILKEQPWAKLPLSQISVTTFARYRDDRLKKVKPSTVRRELGVLQHLFGVAAREWGIPIPVNPVGQVTKPASPPARNRRVAGEHELAALIDASALCLNKRIGPLFLLAIETGMRRGELLNARWVDVDVAKRTLHIPQTKNGHARTIPLTSVALRLLEELPREGERIFPLTPTAVRMAWDRLRKRAGMPDLHFHDLRREAVSSFFEKGLSVPEVALISGHRDMRMLFRYTHLRAEDVAQKLR